MHIIQIKVGTRAQIEAAKLAGELLPGEPYLVSDENRLAIGTGTNSYSAAAKQDELKDEKVAVTENGDAGYLWGTNGSNGVIRSNSSLSISKDINDSYIELAVENVDGGTF